MQAMEDAMVGCMLGTAVGDALGLPLEGMSASSAHRIYGTEVRHRMLGPWGVVSDDTEHSWLVARALHAHPTDPERFGAELLRGLRWWLATLPPGIGWATLRALVRAWLGWRAPGVRSAGNGPAMRSALIGVFHRDDPARIRSFVEASTRLTHTDPRARVAAEAIAVAAALSSLNETPRQIVDALVRVAPDDVQWLDLMSKLKRGLSDEVTATEFARRLGQDDYVTGFAYHSAPVSLYASLRHHDDYASAVAAVLRTGGDVDTTAAMTGAIVGARLGATAIPTGWRDGVVDWPLTPQRLEDAARGRASSLLPLAALPPRNGFVLLMEIVHLIRRRL